MIQATISEAVQKAIPTARLGVLRASVQIEKEAAALWNYIDTELNKLQYSQEMLKDIPAIYRTREAYKALGKEPSRYRASAEALLRRIVQKKGLYQISNVVDCINIHSILTGFSIGGYDSACLQGNIRLDAGRADDVYEAIGRGQLNIESLPVLRDDAGAFGSPTSDSVRTMITENTSHITFVYFDFGGLKELTPAMTQMQELLKKYASATEIEILIA